MQKIFFIEDDMNINELLLYALKSNNYAAEGFDSSEQFWVKLGHETPDLIILDIMLPNENGIDILKKLKNNHITNKIPVIMLTAKSEEMDKIKCFDLGADDYLVKPFSVLELVARIKARLRNNNNNKIAENTLDFKCIKLILDKREVFVNDKFVQLTYKEFELLTYFIHNKELVLSRNQILQNIWGFDFEGESRTVDMHVKTLRQKLLEGGIYIKTIRSVGYKLGE